jgi:hypothetical protein
MMCRVHLAMNAFELINLLVIGTDSKKKIQTKITFFLKLQCDFFLLETILQRVVITNDMYLSVTCVFICHMCIYLSHVYLSVTCVLICHMCIYSAEKKLNK